MGSSQRSNASFSAKHVTELGRLVEQRIQAGAQKIHEHQFDHRPQTRGRGTDGQESQGKGGGGGGADKNDDDDDADDNDWF